MEKESKHLGKIYLGLIIAVISLIGIPFTILYPIALNPIQLILCVVFIVGIIILTKGLIENEYEKTYWLPFLSAGVLTIISIFTPESYNQLVHEQAHLEDVSWLWDLKFGPYFQLTEVFFLVLVLIAAGGIIFISVKSITQFDNIIKYTRVLKTMGNFLIVSSIFLFVGKIFYPATYFPLTANTAGFALVGPFFMGLLTKYELRIFRKNLEFPQDEHQKQRKKGAYARTIAGGYIIIILSVLNGYVGEILFTTMPADIVNLILSYNQPVAIITASLAFISVFCALLYPRSGLILLLVTGIIVLISALLISLLYSPMRWFYSLIGLLYFLIGFLIATDTNKTRKLIKLAKNQ